MDFDSYTTTARLPSKRAFYRYRYSIVDSATLLVIASVVAEDYDVDKKVTEMLISHIDKNLGEEKLPVAGIDCKDQSFYYLLDQTHSNPDAKIMGSKIRFYRANTPKKAGRDSGLGVRRLISETDMESLDDSIFIEAKAYYMEDMHNAAIQKYKEKKNENLERFKQDLFKDLGIEDHPKRENLFNKAWEQGHSGGFREVYDAASDLVELIES